jgi:hypothetical protein
LNVEVFADTISLHHNRAPEDSHRPYQL